MRVVRHWNRLPPSQGIITMCYKTLSDIDRVIRNGNVQRARCQGAATTTDKAVASMENTILAA